MSEITHWFKTHKVLRLWHTDCIYSSLPKKKIITVHAVTLVTLLKQGKIHLREALKNKLYKIVKLRKTLGKLLANFHPASWFQNVVLSACSLYDCTLFFCTVFCFLFFLEKLGLEQLKGARGEKAESTSITVWMLWKDFY